MFLNILNDEEKLHFLNLARHAMTLNGELKTEELEIYSSFRHECNAPHYEAQIDADSIERSIVALGSSRKKHRTIVLIELFAIVLADGEICEEERALLNKLTTRLDFELFEVNRVERWVMSMNDLVEEGYHLIGV